MILPCLSSSNAWLMSSSLKNLVTTRSNLRRFVCTNFTRSRRSSKEPESQIRKVCAFLCLISWKDNSENKMMESRQKRKMKMKKTTFPFDSTFSNYNTRNLRISNWFYLPLLSLVFDDIWWKKIQLFETPTNIKT